MSERVTMPALGESVTEGTVTRWLKNVGDEVEVDEPLLEVSTDKVDTEIPSPVAGTLQEILAEEDETVAVGADLAVIGDGAAAGGDGGAPAEEPAEAAPARLPPGRPRARTTPASPATATPSTPPQTRTRSPLPVTRVARSPQPPHRRTRRVRARRVRPVRRWRRWRWRHDRDDAGPGRVRHRGHHHPLAQGRG